MREKRRMNEKQKQKETTSDDRHCDRFVQKQTLRNLYVNQQDTHCFMIKFIHNTWWLDMFWTSVVHPQYRLQAVCCEFGMW